MRTYVSPIGYDTRRVTRPVLNEGLEPDDRIVLLRPATESDTERATQTIADIEQMLHEIEPNATVAVERIESSEFERAVFDCCAVLDATDGDRIISLGGGARDVLLPLTVATLVYAPAVDTALFFSDVDGSVQEWTLPRLTATVPERATDTVATIDAADGPLSLSEIADRTDVSKSTVVRHVNELEAQELVETTHERKAKHVTDSVTGRLLSRAP